MASFRIENFRKLPQLQIEYKQCLAVHPVQIRRISTKRNSLHFLKNHLHAYRIVQDYHGISADAVHESDMDVSKIKVGN